MRMEIVHTRCVPLKRPAKSARRLTGPGPARQPRSDREETARPERASNPNPPGQARPEQLLQFETVQQTDKLIPH